jgi:ABC-type transporter Mla MlaB component
VLRCAGDEDRGTQGRRRRALARAIAAETDVVVDLTELRFADTTLMLDLAMLSRRLRQCGRAVWIRGAQPQIRALRGRAAGAGIADPARSTGRPGCLMGPPTRLPDRARAPGAARLRRR